MLTTTWWEISVHTDPLFEDLLFWLLEEFGCRGTARESRADGCLVRSYIHSELADEQALAGLVTRLEAAAADLELSPPRVSWDSLAEEDWSQSWKQHWKPEPIGDRFLIQPAWLEPEPTDRIRLTLDPGTAFGTGAHPTTQLCLEGLEQEAARQPLAGQVLADIGCGSGILAIGALLLGAEKVYAVDTDPLAADATRSNADLNGLSEAQLWSAAGSVNELQPIVAAGKPFDGILCNILAHIIQMLMPQITALSRPGTWGILSGTLATQAPGLTATLEEFGWEVTAQVNKGDWCRLHILKR